LVFVQERHARVVGHVQGRALHLGLLEFVGRAEGLVKAFARRVFELRAEVVAESVVEIALEGADAFEKRGLALAVVALKPALFVFAEAMRVVKPAEKFHGVVDAIDAEVDGVNVAVTEPEARAFVRAVGAVGGEREEGLGREIRVALFILDLSRVADGHALGQHAQPPEREGENNKDDRKVDQARSQEFSTVHKVSPLPAFNST
jgi:hypothetical protein